MAGLTGRWTGRAAAAAVIVGTVTFAGAAFAPSPDGALGSAGGRTVPIASAAQDSLGRTIFAGKGNCYTCHGMDAKGTPLAPDLTDTTWIQIKGTLPEIEQLIHKGVPEPKSHPAAMPPMGGAKLTDAEVKAVARYVYSLSHPAK